MDFKYLDQYLEHRKETLPFLGATVSIGDETVYSRVYGNKNDNGDPYDEHTPLYIYSITKTFTTLCAMLLVERGLLRLLDHVSRYFPEFKEMKLRDGSIAKNPILIDHLFTMRAGFDYNLESPEIKAIQAEREFETQDIVKVLSSRPLLFEPGTAWTYSLCHDLLGALIEKITGMTLGQFMEQEIFAPLGMKETTFHPTEETLKNMASQFYCDKGEIKKFWKTCAYRLKSEKYESGGAGLVSTLNDLTIFAKAVTTGKLLSTFARDLWRAPVCPCDTYEGDPWDMPGYLYARGVRVMVDPSNAGVLASKGEFGWGGAASTWIMFDPENQLSAVTTLHILGYGSGNVPTRARSIIYSTIDRK